MKCGAFVWLVFNNPYRICLTNHAFETYAKKRYQRNVLKIINLTTKHFLNRNIFKWLKNLDSYLKQYNFHLLPLISNSWCTWMVFLRVFPLHLHQAQQFGLLDGKPTVLQHDSRGAWQKPPSIVMVKIKELAKYLRVEEVKKREWHETDWNSCTHFSPRS